MCGFYSSYYHWTDAKRNILKPLLDGLLIDGASLKGLDRLFLYSQDDLGERFLRERSALLRHQRGYGHWCWKPHVILETLGKLDEGDYLYYGDVDHRGYSYAVHAATILDNLEQDITAQVYPAKEFQYTKRDVLIALGCDSAEYTDTLQVQAGCILMRKTPFVEEFMREWDALCRDEHLISDSPSKAPNLPGFKLHRHDQSFFSLLYKKRGLKLLTVDEIHRAAGYNGAAGIPHAADGSRIRVIMDVYQAYMRHKFRHIRARMGR